MSLTPEQVQFFRHNGFLKLPAPLPEAFVGQVKDTIERHIREEIAPIVRDRSGRVVRISQLWDRDAVFREAFTRAEVLDPLASLIGENIELLTNRHNHATLRLRSDGGSYLHRDVMQWSRTIVTVLFYLETTTVKNGCTLIVPGSHLLARAGTVNVEKDEALRQTGLLDQVVPVPMPAGGMVVIDSSVIHTAGENHTDGSRMSMTVGFHSVDELSDVENPKRILVRGTRPYQGNDR